MIDVKAAELRQNQKIYLDKASDGEVINVKRPGGRDVVIISRGEYEELQHKIRMLSYAGKMAEFFKANGFPGDNHK